MNERTTNAAVMPLGTSRDAPTEVLRAGAQRLLSQRGPPAWRWCLS